MTIDHSRRPADRDGSEDHTRVSVPQLLMMGPTLLCVDDTPRPITRQQVRRLAIALATRPGETVSADALIEILWGDQLPADPRAALSVVGSRLRTELGDHRDRVTTDANGWAIDIDTDIAQFLAVTDPAKNRSEDHRVDTDVDHAGDRRSELEGAMRLWRGDPLIDGGDDPNHAGIVRLLNDRRSAAAVELSALLVADGAADSAVETLLPLWDDHPNSEVLGVALARAMAAAGQRTKALSTLDATRVALRDSGLDVGESVSQLEVEILRTSVEIDPNVPIASAATDARFVGRNDELAMLTALEPGITVVVGEAGLGKSALLRRACQLWRRDDHEVLRAAAPEFPERPADVVTQLVEQLVVDTPPTTDDPGQRAAIARLVPTLATDGVRLTAVGRDSLVSGVVSYLRSHCCAQRRVVVVDDVHWIDNVSAEVLAQLDDVCVVASSRPASNPGGAMVVEHANRTIDLTPLGADDVRELLELAGVGGTLGRHVKQITDRSGGNALFASLLIDLVVAGVQSTALPASLLLAVQQRLDALSQRARHTLCIASVFGVVAPLDGIESVAPSARTDLVDASDLGLITIDADRVEFVHHLVHEVVVSLLSDGERVGYHEQAGLFLELVGGNPLEVAFHFDWAAPLDPLRAARAHLAAAEAAAAAFDWERVAVHAASGERHVGHDDAVLAAQLVVWIGRAQRILHRNDVDVAQLLDAAVAAREAGHDALFAEAVVGAAVCGWELGGTIEGRLREQHAVALQLDLPDALAAEIRAVGCTFITTDSHAAARSLYHDALARADELTDPTDQASVLRYAKWGLGHPDDLARLGECADRLSRLAGDDLDLFWAGGASRFAYGVMAADRDAIDNAVSDLRNRQQSRPRSTHMWDLAQIETAFALVDGDLELADKWLERMFDLASSQLAQSWALSIYGVMLASVRRQQGRTAELLAVVDHTIDRFDQVPGWHAVAAAAAAAAGEGDRARAELDRLQQPNGEPYENLTWSAAMVMMADAAAAVGDVTIATKVLNRLRPYADRVAWTGVCSMGTIADCLADLSHVVGDEAAAAEFRARAGKVGERLQRRPHSPPLASVS